MVNIKTEDKGKIDGAILEAACTDLKRITAPFISRNENIDIDIVRTRLFQLRNDDQLTVNYDIICPECYDDIETYHNEKDIPLGKELFCENCQMDFVIGPTNILVNFTPNKKYYSKDICKKICKVKKKH